MPKVYEMGVTKLTAFEINLTKMIRAVLTFFHIFFLLVDLHILKKYNIDILILKTSPMSFAALSSFPLLLLMITTLRPRLASCKEQSNNILAYFPIGLK